MECKTFKLVRLSKQSDAIEDFEKSLGEIVSKIASEFQKKPFSASNVKSLANQISELANKKAQAK